MYYGQELLNLMDIVYLSMASKRKILIQEFCHRLSDSRESHYLLETKDYLLVCDQRTLHSCNMLTVGN
jgi:hypothetical protein